MDAAATATTLRQPWRYWALLVAFILLCPVQIAMSSSQLIRGRPRPLHPGTVPRTMVWVRGVLVGVAEDVAIPLQFLSFGNINEEN